MRLPIPGRRGGEGGRPLPPFAALDECPGTSQGDAEGGNHQVGQSIQVTSRVRVRDQKSPFDELAAEGRERERHEDRVGIGPAQMAMEPERLDDA